MESPSLRKPPLAILLAVAAVAFTGCQSKAQRPACPAGPVCLEYGNNSEPLTLDPQRSNLVDEFNIIAELIVGLTTDAPDGSPTPAMATSWETSKDGLTWTFHITWSLGPGRDAKESNDVIATTGWSPIEPPAPLRLLPKPQAAVMPDEC
jgi:oligopeptide transport system substrate-binding protein